MTTANLEAFAPPGPNPQPGHAVPDWVSWSWYEAWYWGVMTCAMLGFSYRSEGSRHVPRRGPALLVANHQSFLDPLLVGLAASRHIYYLARKSLFRNRLFGGFLRSVNCVPVDQEGIAKEGIKTALHQLQAGQVLLVFPEGERTATGRMLPLKPGIQLLIKRADVPVIPVGVAGAFDALPRSRSWPRFAPLFLPAGRGSVAVSIGRPLSAINLRDLPREPMLSVLFDEIQALQQRAERLRRKP